jgi:hypothetical protein
MQNSVWYLSAAVAVLQQYHNASNQLKVCLQALPVGLQWQENATLCLRQAQQCALTLLACD